ncbi:hypothetical protein Psuf_007560 [Phytohabitans suffuscus]|uniref:Uncharacterized protein n=1 Tax=Phytohabitans suffuscus TaxID=624315 RepID=A0A6F8YBP0_9ACTN|nr:hypothetical protein Psuf_007560 [Phytohabitans suffuscus]
MISNTINEYANAIGMVAVSPLDAKPNDARARSTSTSGRRQRGRIDDGHRKPTKDSGSVSGRAGPYRPHIRCEPARPASMTI